MHRRKERRFARITRAYRLAALARGWTDGSFDSLDNHAQRFPSTEILVETRGGRERFLVVIRLGRLPRCGGSRKGGEEGQIIRSRAGQLGESPCSLECRKEETREKVKGWRDAREPNRPE